MVNKKASIGVFCNSVEEVLQTMHRTLTTWGIKIFGERETMKHVEDWDEKEQKMKENVSKLKVEMTNVASLIDVANAEVEKIDKKGNGLRVVLEEVDILTKLLRTQIEIFESFEFDAQSFANPNVTLTFKKILETVEKMELLSLNGHIEVSRARECYTTFVQLEEITKTMMKLTNEIEYMLLNYSQTDYLLTLLARTANRTNLLALNGGIEAARFGNEGSSLYVISNEIKNISETIRYLQSELHIVISEK